MKTSTKTQMSGQIRAAETVLTQPSAKKARISISFDDEANEVDDKVIKAEEELADMLAVDDADNSGATGADELPCDNEADPDEEDPEMVECAKCGTMTHISAGRCSKPGCDYTFKFTSSGHLMDGFVVSENVVEYAVSGDDDEEEEAEYQHSDDSDSDESDSDGEPAPCPWADEDSDGSWEP